MSESFFERTDIDEASDSEPAAEESEAVGRFASSIVADENAYDDRFAAEPEEESSPAEPADTTPDSAVFQSLGVDRAELAEWGHQVGIDDVLAAPKTSADLSRNIRTAAALKAGGEAQQELSERDKDDAASAALERLEEADDESEMYQVANDLLAEAPDRMAELLEQWHEFDPEAASAWTGAANARLAEAEQQMQTLQWTQHVVAQEAARRQHEADSARDTEQAIDEVLAENPNAALVPHETLAELAAASPPTDHSPAGLRAWQAGLLRSAAELERGMAAMRFRQGILQGGYGPIQYSAYGPQHVGVAEPNVDPQRLLPRESAQEQDEAIRRGILHDPTAEYSALMDNLRRTDLALKERDAKQDALRKARGRGGG